jgi:hypothetical protein
MRSAHTVRASFVFGKPRPLAILSCELLTLSDLRARIGVKSTENGWRRKLHHEISSGYECKSCRKPGAKIPARGRGTPDGPASSCATKQPTGNSGIRLPRPGSIAGRHARAPPMPKTCSCMTAWRAPGRRVSGRADATSRTDHRPTLRTRHALPHFRRF